MNPLLVKLAGALAAGGETTRSASSVGDWIGIGLVGLIALFFLWLIVAAVRKKLGSARSRMGEYREDEQEAARAARLWAEARRQAEEEDEAEQEPEPAEQQVDIQQELLEKARQRRQARPAPRPQPPAPAAPEPAEEPARPQAEPTAPAEREEAPAPVVEAEAAPAPQPAEAEEAPRSLEEGLSKTRAGFVSRLGRLFGKSTIDEDDLEEIEEILFTADIGVRTSQKLIDILQQEATRSERADPGKLLGILKQNIEKMLRVESPPLDVERAQPFVMLVVGVNGTGKTTTIGKLAMRYRQQGKQVVLAAADTFRAAAREQLEIWGQRAGVPVIGGQEGADPGSVVFDAINSARGQKADLVIADTAGRLHTKVNLVEELRKVHRVCGKALEGAPHEVLLVLDATTGQNAISQAKQFHKALEVTGLVLTKLDGTAKGGIIIGVCDTFKIPVRFIGIGEQVADLRPFDPEAFVQALFR